MSDTFNYDPTWLSRRMPGRRSRILVNMTPVIAPPVNTNAIGALTTHNSTMNAYWQRLLLFFFLATQPPPSDQQAAQSLADSLLHRPSSDYVAPPRVMPPMPPRYLGSCHWEVQLENGSTFVVRVPEGLNEGSEWFLHLSDRSIQRIRIPPESKSSSSSQATSSSATPSSETSPSSTPSTVPSTPATGGVQEAPVGTTNANATGDAGTPIPPTSVSTDEAPTTHSSPTTGPSMASSAPASPSAPAMPTVAVAQAAPIQLNEDIVMTGDPIPGPPSLSDSHAGARSALAPRRNRNHARMNVRHAPYTITERPQAAAPRADLTANSNISTGAALMGGALASGAGGLAPSHVSAAPVAASLVDLSAYEHFPPCPVLRQHMPYLYQVPPAPAGMHVCMETRFCKPKRKPSGYYYGQPCFASSQSLDRHINSVAHRGVKVPCPHCGMPMARTDTKHARTCTGPKKGPGNGGAGGASGSGSSQAGPSRLAA
ncbi:unnamed protein product [Peniophora sp. CBMAI 1063]|nr:unnamed protein product [Peniophora sp. CBMAI 1063]